MKFRVNEIFSTIQGEARWAGAPSTFVRLQGCKIGCHWCDTKHTWHDGKKAQQVDVRSLLQKVDNSPTWSEMTVAEVVEYSGGPNIKHTVLTGGEPFAQDIAELIEALLAKGTVQVETSGAYPIVAPPKTWVTVSPKFGMSGGMDTLPESFERANEIKMPVVSVDDIVRLKKSLGHANPNALIWLQPVSQNETATRLCVESCMNEGWNLSLQVHKFAGLR